MSKMIDKLLKKIDSDGVERFSDKDPFNDVSMWVHSGSPELDFNIGTYGFPVGITEISGKSKSGKTTLALHAMKNFQKTNPNGVSIILSSENRDNKMYAEKIGVNTEEVIIIKSKFVEDLFFKLQNYIDDIESIWKEEKYEGKPKIFVYWDSLGATLSRAEAETFLANAEIERKNSDKGTKTEYKHAQMGSFAKNAKAAMKAMLSQIYEKDIIFIILNHVIDNFNTGGVDSPGGGWVEFLPCLRLRTKRISWEKIDDVEVGQITEVKVEKNDFGTRKKTQIEFLLGKGMVLSKADIEYAIERGIIKKEGALKHSFMGGKLTWNSKRTFYQNYLDGNKFINILETKIRQERHKDVLKSKEI